MKQSPLLLPMFWLAVGCCNAFAPSHQTVSLQAASFSSSSSSWSALPAMSDREADIRRKILKLKREGKLKRNTENDVFAGMDDDIDDDNNNAGMDYTDKVKKKLGAAKSKMLGFTSEDEDDDDNEADDDTQNVKKARIGSLSNDSGNAQKIDRQQKVANAAAAAAVDENYVEDDDDDELEEDDLVDLVAKKLQEQRDAKRREEEEALRERARERLQKLEQERKEEEEQQRQRQQEAENQPQEKLTSGVGGRWLKNETAVKEDVYQPKTGSWGAFPRPRDISKAYGGGRRIGPGYSNEQARLDSTESTRNRLRDYRKKMGIEVESEKEHASEIEEALSVASLAMQRGVYTSAVSALEKVTRYCSTNSKVGGKVFLELAMAYEASGRTQEAITVYTTLSRSRIEKIKINAKRLLYGIEAMQFMQENLGSSDFSRKRAKTTFIETTGFGDIATKFDDRYNTAYLDLSKGYYKQLTESVVRSAREAQQILLRATGPGEVERLRIVQALRSLNRRFDEALQKEMEMNAPAPEPIALMDGKPIVKTPKVEDEDEELEALIAMGEFVLKSPEKMRNKLQGEWRLQLIADKRGDGVKFFNTTLAWQTVDMDSMSFQSLGPQGFLTVKQSGGIAFNDKRRILQREDIEVSGSGVLAGLFGSKTGAVGAVALPQQVVSVDAGMLVTRHVPSEKGYNKNDEKDYFAVWRRVEPGTYSSTTRTKETTTSS